MLLCAVAGADVASSKFAKLPRNYHHPVPFLLRGWPIPQHPTYRHYCKTIVRHSIINLMTIAPYEMMACQLCKSELTPIHKSNQNIPIVSSSTSTSATESDPFTGHTYVPHWYPKFMAHTNPKTKHMWSSQWCCGGVLSSCEHLSTHRLRHRVIPPGL